MDGSIKCRLHLREITVCSKIIDMPLKRQYVKGYKTRGLAESAGECSCRASITKLSTHVSDYIYIPSLTEP